MKGDPHWDTELWTTMGHLYRGGMWLKKQSVIAAEQTPIKTISDLKTAAPDGTDYRTIPHPTFTNSSIAVDKPTNLNDYFYLPARGSYLYGGTLQNVGEEGFYWSCTPDLWNWYFAGMIELSQNQVIVNTTASSSNGFIPWTAQ